MSIEINVTKTISVLYTVQISPDEVEDIVLQYVRQKTGIDFQKQHLDTMPGGYIEMHKVIHK